MGWFSRAPKPSQGLGSDIQVQVPAAPSMDEGRLRSGWGRLSDKARAILRETRDVTDREIRAIGGKVDHIIRSTTAHLRDTRAQVEANTTRFAKLGEQMAALKEELASQGAQIAGVLDRLQDISEAGRNIKNLAVQSRILAINSRIEAARLGEKGKPFEVIAHQTHRLNGQIETINQTISTVAEELCETLPAVAERGKAIAASFEAFQVLVDEMGTWAKESRESGIEEIVQDGYQALSHLQFQDPMIQRLEEIDGELRRFAMEVAESTGVTLEEIDPVYIEKMGVTMTDGNEVKPDIDAGDVMLF